MKNITIAVTDNNIIVVRADTKRFGIGAILFEGYTFMQCCEYIRKMCRTNHFKLNSWSTCKTYTDPDGRTMPIVLNVSI